MPTNDQFEDVTDIEARLLALESGGERPDREICRAEVRDYGNYFVARLTGGNDEPDRIYTLPNLYGIDSIPVFLSEEVFFKFRDDYLKKHGLFDELENRGESLEMKAVTGRELFEMLPETRLSGFFVLPSAQAEDDELSFSFNLARVFTDCFQETQTEIDWDSLEDAFEISDLPRTDDPELIKARREIGTGRNFRTLFENEDWFVLTSQPTANRLLKGEISREDFDLDRFSDRRVVIFSEMQALEDFKIATGQQEAKFYNIKVNAKRIFGRDLSNYDLIVIDPRPPLTARIDKEDFKRLNDLFAAFELENKLVRIKETGIGHGPDYIGVKEFRQFILPMDARRKETNILSLEQPVYMPLDEAGNKFFPVFTAIDCFESFRLRCDDITSVEPCFIDGETLFRMWDLIDPLNMVFNPAGPPPPLTFSPNFALQVYCA